MRMANAIATTFDHNNVTNTRYLTQVTASTFGAGAVWAYPATYGVDLKFRLH
jgi:hypothetical protein